MEERLHDTLTNIHFIPEKRILELLGEAGFTSIEPFYGRSSSVVGWHAGRDSASCRRRRWTNVRKVSCRAT